METPGAGAVFVSRPGRLSPVRLRQNNSHLGNSFTRQSVLTSSLAPSGLDKGPAPRPRNADGCRLGLGALEIAEVTDDIEDRVVKIIAVHLGVEENTITRGTSFVDDLNVDSLDTIELVMDFEDEFEVTIPEEDVERLHTVGSVIDFIAKRI